MPQLEEYQQKTQAQGQLGGGNFTVPEIISPMGKGLQQAGQALTEFGMQMEQNTAKAWFAQSSSEIDLNVHKDFLNAQNTAPAGAGGFTDAYLKRLKDLEAESLKNAPNAQARRMMQMHFASVREQYGKAALGFEIGEKNRYVDTSQRNAADNRSKLISEMPDNASVDKEAEKAIVLNNAEIDKLDIPPDQKQKLKDDTREALLDAANKRKIEIDPQGYRKRTEVYKGGFDNVVGVILQEEGGYADNDGGTGAPVNHGINQAANPDIDVKTLTKEDAKKIYKDRYWNAIGGDNLPPNMQLLAMDAAVNQGVGWTQKALKEAGNDPQKFIRLRAERYQEISKNPSKAKYLGPWLDRLDRVAKRSGGASGISTYDLGTYAQQQKWNNFAEQEERRQQAVLQSTVNTQYADEMAMALDNKQPPTPLTREVMQKAYGEVEGNQKYDALEKNRQLGSDIDQFKTMTDGEIALKIKEAEPKAGDGYAEADKRYKVMQEAAKNVVEQRKADPVAYAQKVGIAPMHPLDGKDAETIAAQMKQRAGVSLAMHQKYGTPLAVFTKGEAEAIGNSLKEMPIAGKMQWIQTLRGALPDPEMYKAALQQIRPDSPVTAMAGVFMSMQGQAKVEDNWFSADVSVTPQEVAEKLLKGEALLNPVSGEKKEDGTVSKYPMPSEKDLRQSFNDYVGDAFRNMPQNYNEAYQAYRAFYAAETSEKGLPSSDIDTDAADKSVKSIIGTTVDFNGGGNVIAPWGMNEADFDAAIHNKWNAFAKSQGYDEKQTEAFSGYGLMPSDSAGRYYVTSGNMIARDKEGKPVILDITK